MNADNPHLKRSLPAEYLTFDVDGRTLIARDVPEGTVELFEVLGLTRNVRVLANDDAVLYEGQIVTPYYRHEYRCVDLAHSYGGTVASPSVVEWLADPAVRLRKIRSVGTEAIARGLSV